MNPVEKIMDKSMESLTSKLTKIQIKDYLESLSRLSPLKLSLIQKKREESIPNHPSQPSQPKAEINCQTNS